MKLHFGIPKEITKSDAYLNKYYADFMWRKSNLMGDLEPYWNFKVKKMEEQLIAMNETEK